MFNPDMMKQAQEMMANMSPEQMKQMTEMASKMDPSVLQSMGGRMGGMPMPSADEMKKAQDQMKNMSADDLKDQMENASNQMKGQNNYMTAGVGQLKLEGNKFVGEQKYNEAKEKYESAIEKYKSNNLDDKMLLESCLLNLGLCQLKLEDFFDCAETCSEILQTCDLSSKPAVKAIFRRGSALSQLPGRLREGYIYIKRANHLSPEDGAIEAEYKKVRERAESGDIDLEDADNEAVGMNATDERPPPPENYIMPASSSSQPAPAATSSGAKIEELPEEDDDAESDDESSGDEVQEEEKPKEKEFVSPLKGKLPKDASPDKIKEVLSDSNNLKQASDVVSGMSADDIAKMTGQPKEQAEQMKEAMRQMNENPEMMKQMQDMMKNMSQEDMQNIVKMQQGMMGGGAPGASGSSGSKSTFMKGGQDGAAPKKPEDMMKDPEMVKAAESFVKNLSPEMIQETMKSQGYEVSDSQAKWISRIVPYAMIGYRYFLHLRNGMSWLFTKDGRLVLGVLLLIVAVYSQMGGSAVEVSEQPEQ